MEWPLEDDAAWAEARRKADVVSRTLADAPADVRLSLAEAARMLASGSCHRIPPADPVRGRPACHDPAARAACRSQPEYRSAGPLDVVQIDHTTVDLIVV